MQLREVIGLLSDLQPIVIGKLHENPVLVAVVDDVEVDRLVPYGEAVDLQFVRRCDVDRRLHRPAGTEPTPAAGTERAVLIRVLCRARLLAERQMQMVMFPVYMLPLDSFQLLDGLTHGRRWITHAQEAECTHRE